MRHEEQQQGARNIWVMKKILLMAAIVLSSLGVKAQTEPGTFTLMPKVGLNMAKSGFDDTKMKAGAVAGVDFCTCFFILVEKKRVPLQNANRHQAVRWRNCMAPRLQYIYNKTNTGVK